MLYTRIVSGIIGFLLLLTTGWLLNDFVRSSDRVQISEQVVKDAASVRNALLSAETGQRGFIITDDEGYLLPYKRALAVIPARISNLKISTAYDADQHKITNDLTLLVEDKLAELKKTLELRRAVSFEAAQKEVQTHLGRSIMESINDKLDSIMITEESNFSKFQYYSILYAKCSFGALIASFVFLTIFFAMEFKNKI